MSQENGSRVEEIFHGALEKSDSLRPQFLDEACAGDESLKAEVQKLLHRDAQAIEENFLAQPSPGTVLDGTSVSGSGQTLIGRQIGPYVVQVTIGSGGMGTVYLAERVGAYRQKVVLKVIKEGFEQEEFLRRFRNERQVLARLNHPNIARLLDGGATDAGEPYLVMEFIDGEPLDTYCVKHSPTIRERLLLLSSVCTAIHYAHQQTVIHRDLKPANILVDTTGRPKVVDFGVARVANAEVRTTTVQTEAGRLIGTLTYMSPEQVEADPEGLDTRSDIYALGVIAYELFAGKLPYELAGKSIPEAARIICEVEPQRLGLLDRAFRGDIETIVAKALEKDKGRRYQSASDLARDIDRFLNDEPILARPPSATYQFLKFTRRNKTLVAGVVVAFLALVLGAAGSAFAASKFFDQRNQAQKLLADSYVQAANTAMNRGQWRAALTSFDEALTFPTQAAASLHLGRGKAFLAVNERQNAEEELKHLEGINDDHEKAGEVMLFHAMLSMGQDNEKADRLFKSALNLGLSDADCEYANGMIAERTLEAVSCFERALKVDPFHHQSNAMLALLLITLGRFDEAKQRVEVFSMLFPEDPNGKVLQALLMALKGDLAGALQIVEKGREQFSDREVSTVMAALKLIDLMRKAGEVQLGEPGSLNRWFIQIMMVASPMALQVPSTTQTSHVLLSLPPCLRNGIGRIWAVLMTFAKNDPQKAIQALSDAAEIHPDGLLHYVRGMLLYYAGQYAEAEKALSAAVQNPSMVPVRRPALCFSAITQGELGFGRITNHQDPAMRSRSVANIKELLQGGSVEDGYSGLLLAIIARRTGEFDLARLMLADLTRKAPTEFNVWRERARLEMETSTYALALQAAEKALSLVPTDTEMQQTRRSAVEKLREQLETLSGGD